MENIFQYQKSIQDNIQKSFIQDEEYIIKGVEGDIIVYDQLFQFEDIKRYTNDVNKAFTAGEISQDELEKAKKDLSRLAMRQVFDKNGHKRIVYVKIHEDEHGTTHETDFDKDDVVKFTKDGKEMSGTIKSMKYHDKTDKVGTAMVEVDGKVYSVSMSKLSHEDDDFKKPNPLKVGSTPEIEAVKKRTARMKDEDEAYEKEEKSKIISTYSTKGGKFKRELVEDNGGFIIINYKNNEIQGKNHLGKVQREEAIKAIEKENKNSKIFDNIQYNESEESEKKALKAEDEYSGQTKSGKKFHEHLQNSKFNEAHKDFHYMEHMDGVEYYDKKIKEAKTEKDKKKFQTLKENHEANMKWKRSGSEENGKWNDNTPEVDNDKHYSKDERRGEHNIKSENEEENNDYEDDGGLLSEVNEKLLEAENQLKSAKERGRFATSTQHRLVSDLNLLRLGFDSKRNVGKIARNVGTKGYYYHPSAVELAKKRYEELTQNKNSSKQVEDEDISKAFDKLGTF